MGPAEPASELDSTFTLDAALLQQRRAANARRVHAYQLPLIRSIGFVVLCVIAVLNDLRIDAAFPSAALLLLIALNLAYPVFSWAVLWKGHGRTGRLDLSLLFLHLDVLMWLVNLHHLEQSQLFFAYLLLVRVADQVGFGFRRAFYFNHVVIVAYLGYAAWVAVADPAAVHWPERLSIAAGMYMIGGYLALTGFVIQRLRNRARSAVRAARQLVDTLEQKTSDLEAQAHELERSRQLAEQANVAKSQFLAMISHELRTPLNGILGTTELLLDTPLTDKQRQYTETAHRSGSALLALVDDVLDLSRIEAGKLSLRMAAFDLRALVAETMELMAATALDKPLELSWGVARDLPERLEGDPVRLRQLLVNLLHNAIKFTERGSVALSVTLLDEQRDTAHLRFEVSDTGIGVPGAQIDSVFDAFMQGDTSSTRRHGGSGLGLAIVRELTQLMSGEVGVNSTPGKGSMFWFNVSLKKAPPEPEPEPPAPSSHGVNGHVLLAEDDLVNQLVVHEMLSKLGCHVDVVNDGFAAQEAASQQAYGLIFMDCHMPVMDGYTATRHIRAHELERGLTRTPIVALTAAALTGDRDRCIESGMDDYMTKPVSMAQLQAAVQRWMSRPGTKYVQ
ncbi:ATP-binding protein [Piscinibacter sp.]|uniref:ATP-binding protein n=1 Tax=Piscinibacter sp. TaxID=1903157 RepID=UPI00355A7854